MVDKNKLCDDLLDVVDLSSIFEQIEADKSLISKKNKEIKESVDNKIPHLPYHTLKTSDNASKKEVNSKGKSKFNAVFGHIPITSINFIGQIKRTVPFSEKALQSVPVQALKRTLDELGVTDAMPSFYKNRMKNFVKQGFVSPDGQSFTAEGQKIAASHLEKKGYSHEDALKLASQARSLEINPNRALLASTPIMRRSFSGDITEGYINTGSGITKRDS